jgi:hypothetical protein
VPVGLDYTPGAELGARGCALSFLYSLGFLIRLHTGYEELFTKVGTDKILTPGAVMPDFTEILAGSLAGFGVVALSWPPWRMATIILPLSGQQKPSISCGGCRTVGACKALRRPARPVRSGGVLLAFWCCWPISGSILLVTPEGCLTPGQWQKIWSIL